MQLLLLIISQYNKNDVGKETFVYIAHISSLPT